MAARLFRRAFPLIGLLAACVVLAALGDQRPELRASQRALQAAVGSGRGAELFRQQCALCHGERGAGDGLIAALLSPRPRDFTAGRFRLVSTLEGGPTDDDLLQVLQRGIPGSIMPSWGWLPLEDQRALVAHVRELAVQGVARRLMHQEEELDRGHALELAALGLAPGPEVPPVPELEPTARVLARGRFLYEQSCATCHGPHGQGPAQPQLKPEGGFHWARDFTAGILAGGGSHRELAERLLAGIPGTSMAPTPLEPQDAGALVAYVRTLMQPGADQALVQRRTRIRASRVLEGNLPEAPSDPRWQDVPEVEIPLAPLVWSSVPPMYVRIAALHDGRALALRMVWSDDTRDQRIPSVREEADGAAVALSADAMPPPFGMGGPGAPVEMWHWRADRAIDLTGVLDLLSASPHVLDEPVFMREQLDVTPRYLPAPAVSSPSGDVAGAQAEGPGILRHGQPAGGVHAVARWDSGEWQIVLLRELPPRAEGDLALRPGASMHVSFALWNGARSGQLSSKSVSMWHELGLAP